MREERIGNQRLILGDCLEVLPTLEAGSVDAVVTDPPYGLHFPYASYDDTRENLVKLIDEFIPLIIALSRRVLVLCGPTQIGLYPQPSWVSCITWDTTGSFGRYGYSQWTPVLCYGDDLPGFGNVNGVMKTDTIRLSGGGGVGFMRSNEEARHTCPKPLTMMVCAVRRFTTEGETVLDPFLGSGTTLVAAEQLGRPGIGIEIDPQYFEVACKRVEQAAAQPRLFAPDAPAKHRQLVIDE
jgi:DNA modification methylase